MIEERSGEMMTANEGLVGLFQKLMETRCTNENKREVMCKRCNDEGLIYTNDENGYLTARKCECAIMKEIQENIQKCGLNDFFQHRTFENYNVTNKAQENALERCKQYVEAAKEKPYNLILSGQIGSGKTHLAAATLLSLARMGKTVRFMNYKEMVKGIALAARDDTAYFSELNKYIHPSILLIDDFLKGRDHKETHLSYLYEIVNARYNANLRTIITTEKSIDELIEIEEAVASRLFERAKGFIVLMGNIKNYRLYGKGA